MVALMLTSAPAAVAQEPTRRRRTDGITATGITGCEIDGHLRFLSQDSLAVRRSLL